MKLSSSLALLSIAIPILSAPLPADNTPSIKCGNSTPCPRPSFRALISVWTQRTTSRASKSSANLPFNLHNLLPTVKDTLLKPDTKLLAPAANQHEAATSDNFGMRPEDWKQAFESETAPAAEAETDAEASMELGAKTLAEEVQNLGYGHKALKGCHKAATITYTYGYTYIRKDHADVLIVGLVVMFLAAVLMVEMFDTLFDSAKTTLGLQEQVEAEDEESLPVYCEVQFADVKWQPECVEEKMGREAC